MTAETSSRTDSCRAPRPGMQWSGFLDMRVAFTPAAVGRRLASLAGEAVHTSVLGFYFRPFRLTLKSGRVALGVVLLTACEPLCLISLSGSSGRTGVGIPAPHRGHRLTGWGGHVLAKGLMQWWLPTGRLVHVRWFFFLTSGAVPLWAVLGGRDPQTQLCECGFQPALAQGA